MCDRGARVSCIKSWIVCACAFRKIREEKDLIPRSMSLERKSVVRRKPTVKMKLRVSGLTDVIEWKSSLEM
jgi:hypothetical protein